MPKSRETAGVVPLALDVAVCTRNRLPMLRQTVDAILVAARSRASLRLLVVDNGSGDGTAEYLAELAAGDDRVVALSEPRPGLYYARVAAIRAARGDLLVFLDDDVVPEPDFLDHVAEAFADPTVGVVGGAIHGIPQGPLPSWFLPKMWDSIPVLPVRGRQEECSYPGFPPGAALGCRRVPCLELYLTPERASCGLGLGGPAGVGGEDTDLCEIYARAGYRVVRVAAARVGHHVLAAKLTPAWITDKFFADGRLRVMLARLRGKPGLCRETAIMLAAFPLVAAAVLVAPLMGEGRRLLVRAYLAKSRGAWRELLRGERGVRFSYPSRSAGKG